MQIFNRPIFRVLLTTAAIVLATIPAIVMTLYVTTRGAAGFGDDFGYYVVPLARMWNEGISYHYIMKEAPHGPHFVALPLLFRAVAVQLGNWDHFLEIYASLLIGVARVILLYFIFAIAIRHLFARMMFLIFASFLVFAPAQLGLYVYGDTGLTMGADNLGFLVGLVGCLQFPRRWVGVFLVVLGGVLSAWSWGMVVVWAIFFVLIFINRFTWMQIGVVAVGAFAAHLPMVQHAGAFSTGGVSYDYFNFHLIIAALGRPFIPNVDEIANVPFANWVGAAGLAVSVVFAVAIIIEVVRLRHIPKWCLPGSALIAFAISYLYQVSLVRQAVGPWYVAISVNFWIGLIGLALSIARSPARISTEIAIKWLLPAAILLSVSVMYVFANRDFTNKTPFLQARTLSSDSCQRNYRTAPTFCEMLVFMWPPTYDFASFSRFFEESRTASFAVNQTWTLQGDWLLSNVVLVEEPSHPQVQWVKKPKFKAGARPEDWLTHERLSLFVPAGQAVRWTVTIPAGVKKAVFRTRITPRTTRATLKLSAQGRPLYSTAVADGAATSAAYDLSSFAGSTTTLTLSASDGAVVMEHPRISIRQPWAPKEHLSVRQRDIQPAAENTELSSIDLFPDSPEDTSLVGRQSVAWGDLYSNLLTPPHGPVCAGDVEAIKIAMRMPQEITMRMVNVIVATRSAIGNYYENVIRLPLLMDDKLHRYAIPTKMIPYDKRDRIESIRITALSDAGTDHQRATMVGIPEVRLVRSSVGGFCN